MTSNRRTTQRNKIIGALVFYRGENDPVERERMGLLEEVGRSSIFVATHERLPQGARLHLRIYSPAAPAGQTEVSVRGVVNRPSEDPKGLMVTLVSSGALGDDRLQSFLQMMSAGLRPAHADYAAAPL
jgi:hypothetical protein